MDDIIIDDKSLDYIQSLVPGFSYVKEEMTIDETKKCIIAWLNKMKHGYKYDVSLPLAGGDVLELSGKSSPDDYLTVEKRDDGEVIKIKLCTDCYNYSITAKPPRNGGKGYLGAWRNGVRNLSNGEDTCCGDLHDGIFSYETWVDILADIVGSELVSIRKKKNLNGEK